MVCEKGKNNEKYSNNGQNSKDYLVWSKTTSDYSTSSVSSKDKR